jgi:hypothetical protein
MKNLIYLLVLFLLPSCAALTPIPISYESFLKTKEITADKNRADLFVAANSWMVETFNDAESVIQFSDKEAGIIKGRYLLGGAYETYTLSGHIYDRDTRVYATITIMVKDSLSKITIAPIGSGVYYKPMANGAQNHSNPSPDEMKNEITDLMARYEVYIYRYKKW